MFQRILLAVACLGIPPGAAGQTPAADPTASLVIRLEQAIASGDAEAALQLGESSSVPGLRAFSMAATPPPTRFIIKERDRATLPTAAERLLLEVFSQYGNESMIATWRVDVVAPEGDAAQRRIAEMEQLSVVSGLHRLSLNVDKHFEVKNLTVQAVDLTLEIPSGHAFVAETSDGPTAVVLIGRGEMRFTPSDAAERTQVRIFSGAEDLAAEFDAAFVRVRPADFSRTFEPSSMIPRPVGASELRRASEIFDQHVRQTLHLDLTDLSREPWSLIPSPGDFIAEIRTRRLGTLTYARSTKDAEDVSLFERRRRRNIAVYASKQKLAARGRFYSEDELVDYDVLRYDVDAAFSPERAWVDGTAELRLKVRSYVLTALTLRLAEPLVVRSVVSPELGRLLHLRVVGQNSVVVNFPATVARNTELSLQIVYGGRLEPQHIEREGITVDQQQELEQVFIPIEPQYIYSNRSYWYPQATVTDYAIARLRVAVPEDYNVVASGSQIEAASVLPAAAGDANQRPRRLFVFEADRPLRYLACVISRFSQVHTREMLIPLENTRITGGPPSPGAGNPGDAHAAPSGDDPSGSTAAQNLGLDTSSVTLRVHANPRQTGRARSLTERTAAIYQYYGALIGDAPYPTFTLAVTENELPGGHSPAYFAILNHPPPTAPLVWRNDPVAFENYQPFFLAHEIAHQWWGQAIGWKNYHEQWLSEGFAQYFAALYGEKDRGDDLFVSLLRQMRRTAIAQSDQGPVYLGYRLGHIRNEGRVFRSLVYNKGAMVLHMLRRLLGDDTFFAGIREFYAEWKYRKAGTDDLRAAMERVSSRELDSFFDAWIYGSAIPEVRFTSSVAGSEAQLRFEHVGSLAPVPITVSVNYSDGRSESMVVAVVEKVETRAMPLTGTVRSIEVNRDHGALAEIVR
jgi:hypothetical protein